MTAAGVDRVPAIATSCSPSSGHCTRLSPSSPSSTGSATGNGFDPDEYAAGERG